MPKIRWTDLPSPLREHLFDRLREREITPEDLYQLKRWREIRADAPDGPWYKDFGSFKICGEGRYPKTFLLRGQAAPGAETIDRPGCETTAPMGETFRRGPSPTGNALPDQARPELARDSSQGT